MKLITLFAFLTLIGNIGFGQNLVGYNDQEIKKYMKENRMEMNFNNVKNNNFMYLKYSDSFDSQTLLFFLNPDSVCRSVRLICDNRLKDGKVKEFNSIYTRDGDNRWIDKRDGNNYLIEVKDEKWSCVITIQPYK